MEEAGAGLQFPCVHLKLLTLPLHHYCTHQVRAGIGGLGVAALYVGRRQSDERGYCAHREDWLLGVMGW